MAAVEPRAATHPPQRAACVSAAPGGCGRVCAESYPPVRRRSPRQQLEQDEVEVLAAGDWSVVGPDVPHGIRAGDTGARILAIIVPRRSGVDIALGNGAGAPTVGVRCPDHPVPRALCVAVGPLATTSANLHGDATPPTADEVRALFGDAVAVVIDGGRCEGEPSTVVDCTGSGPTLIREGTVPWAEVLGANDVYIGVNALDYSGYPDCRPEYIQAFEHMANIATKAAVEGRQRLKIHAPLIQLTKAEIIARGLALGVDYSLTSSCYDPSPAGEARHRNCVSRRPDRVFRGET